MGKTRVIAETGAGQHGVATATACALLGLDCVVYMGSVDIERQALNVYRMRLLGAKVVAVDSGSRTLKDAINEAMRDWVANYGDDALRPRLGPRPAPLPADGARLPRRHRARGARPGAEGPRGRLPDLLVACVGGGSNAIGLFHAFLADARGRARRRRGRRAQPPRPASTRPASGRGASASSTGRGRSSSPDDDGQILPTHSVSAGLDYPAVGPEHAQPRRARADALRRASPTTRRSPPSTALAEKEGIIPALETAHAVAWVLREAPKRPGSTIVS